MSGISHCTARRMLLAAADDLLKGDDRVRLDRHLENCQECHSFAEELERLSTRLQRSFHARWDVRHRFSKDLAAKLGSDYRRMKMAKRAVILVKTLATLAAVILLTFVLAFAFRRLLPVPAKAQTPLPHPTTVQPAPTSAPYSGLIAFVSQIDGNDEIYTMHADGSAMKQLTAAPAQNDSPAWSPDGRKIAFVSGRTDNADIFLMNADGSSQTQLTDNPGYDGFLSWSPDGQKIAYLSSATQDPNLAQVMVMNPDGSGKTRLTAEAGSYLILSWSPDSRQAVYVRQAADSTTDSTLFVNRTNGTDEHELLQGAISDLRIRWLDAQSFYLVVGFTPWQLYRLNITGTAPRLLVSSDTPISAWFGTEPDLTYIIKRSNAWNWFRLQGTSGAFLTSWIYSSGCQQFTSDLYLNDAAISLSPDGSRGLVSVFCDEGASRFYLVNADGSTIQPLFGQALPGQVGEQVWSPDGKYALFTLGDNQTGPGDIYRVDLEKMLHEPTARPVPLTSDNTLKYDLSWQPMP